MGALPTLYAATSPEVRGGDHPARRHGRGSGDIRRRSESNAASRDTATAKRLWEVSEQLTGVRYAALAG